EHADGNAGQLRRTHVVAEGVYAGAVLAVVALAAGPGVDGADHLLVRAVRPADRYTVAVAAAARAAAPAGPRVSLWDFGSAGALGGGGHAGSNAVGLPFQHDVRRSGRVAPELHAAPRAGRAGLGGGRHGGRDGGDAHRCLAADLARLAGGSLAAPRVCRPGVRVPGDRGDHGLAPAAASGAVTAGGGATPGRAGPPAAGSCRAAGACRRAWDGARSACGARRAARPGTRGRAL
ncbi:MAG: hypothetical protein AVDCRST_MAG77-1090, partial [uncultured Chloroflexi bacterium]